MKEELVGKVIKRNDSKEVVTVILSERKPLECKKFHCLNCGRTVFNYYTPLKVVVQGEVSDIRVKRPIDVMCSRCGLIHRIV